MEASSWLHLDAASVTEDTPVPFDLREVWYRLDRENRRTVYGNADSDDEALISEGDATSLVSAIFEPYGPGSTPPNQASTYGAYGSTPELLRLGLKDPRLQFLLEDSPDPRGTDPLHEAMLEWLESASPSLSWISRAYRRRPRNLR